MITSTGRALGPGVLLAAAVAGLSWAPTFIVTALTLPVLASMIAVLAVDQLTLGRPGAELLRPVLGLAAGAAAIVLVFRLAEGADLTTVLDGTFGGWQRTLGSTLPARPDADLMAFVPALALLAAVIGTEWARRGGGPTSALLPAFVVLGLGQLFRPATGWHAPVIAVAFGVAAVVVLLLMRQRGRTGARRPVNLVAPMLLATVIVAGLAGWWASALELPGRESFSLQDGQGPSTRTISAPDPLEQIATMLLAGDRPAFSVRTEAVVDRWPLVVLDHFDGANWSSGARLLTLGTELSPPPVTAPVATRTAEISGLSLDGPWLPSHERLRTADGIRPLVDPATSVLVRGDRTVERYILRWDDVLVAAESLTSSAIDPQPVGAVAFAGIPVGIADLARGAVGLNAAPTVQAALVLEKWMQQNYQVATGEHIPSGHSWAQLLHFLTTSKRGTSEQFATSYAAMAASLGIPVRVVVGFRNDGSGSVHVNDVLAWPEIAVSGLGWVPLDPTGGARAESSGGSDLSSALQAARDELPSADRLASLQPEDAPSAGGPSGRPVGLPLWWLAALVPVAVAAVPAAKQGRRALRRRAAPRTAVFNAWRDTRDILLDHGVAVPAGSTARSVADGAPVDRADLEALARCIDGALWAGREPDPAAASQAWVAAARIRRGLRAGPWRRRLRAAFALRTFRRGHAGSQAAPRSDWTLLTATVSPSVPRTLKQ